MGTFSQRILVKSGPDRYEIIVGKSREKFAGTFAHLAHPGSRVGIVADAAVAGTYGLMLARSLERAGYPTVLKEVPSGERSKTLRQAERLYRVFAKECLERRSWLLAVGGGVVGDLTGFIAATYLRGIPYVQFPTTLLAQVDASIGGKTGVDIAEGKNLVGTFYQPKLVWIDPSVLRSLPKEHWRNGMAEIIKYGAILDAKLFTMLERRMESLLRGYSPAWGPIIARCARLKAQVVARDPRETGGGRAILNFGHSVGHAIEAATDYNQYLHGEAIAIGMFVAAFISQQMGLIQQVDRIRLGTLLTRSGLPIRVSKPVPRARILEHLARDKKVKDGSVRFVLLEGIGRAHLDCRVAPEVLELALSAAGISA